MNANELADDMENGMFNDTNYNKKKAANFVRQQQAEIEALKQIIDANNLSQNIGQFVKPAKTLTDEEIVNLYKETEADNGGIREFARAILRKAQEK
jgi:hypothetical protein